MPRPTSVLLPMPPSANNLFFNLKRGGRVPTTEYKQWLKVAVPLLQGLKAPEPPVCMVVVLNAPINMRSDGDNRLKPLTDAAVKAGVIPDDNLKVIQAGRWSYCASPKPNAKGLASVSFEAMP